MVVSHSLSSQSKSTCWHVITLVVSVPVLLLQMTEVDPNVLTDSRFLTQTFFSNIRFAVNVNGTVIVVNRPSGTFATMIPIRNTTLSTKAVPRTAPMMKNEIPRAKAIIET